MYPSTLLAALVALSPPLAAAQVVGTEGIVSEKGCRLKSGCNASNGGQDTIGKDSCDSNESEVDVKYDKAAKTQLTVGSNKSTNVLLEGNVFESVTTPMTADSSKSGAAIFNVPDSGSISTCSSSLGRSCVANTLSWSGSWPSLKNSAALTALAEDKANLVKPIQASKVTSTVSSKAGIGKV